MVDLLFYFVKAWAIIVGARVVRLPDSYMSLIELGQMHWQFSTTRITTESRVVIDDIADIQ